MADQTGAGERVVQIERLELRTLNPLENMIIRLGGHSAFHAILEDPSSGRAIVRPWVGGGQRNAGYRDARAIIGTRPYIEGAEPLTEPIGEQVVDWGGITFGHELVLRNDEGGVMMFTGKPVEAVEAQN